MDLLIYLSKHDSNYFSTRQMLRDQLILLTEYKYTFVNIIIIIDHCKPNLLFLPTELLRSSVIEYVRTGSSRQSFIGPAKLFAK